AEPTSRLRRARRPSGSRDGPSASVSGRNPADSTPGREQQAVRPRGASGMTYAPTGPRRPVVGPGEFPVAAMHLDHGHIFGQCQGLVEAGAEVVAVYDPDPARVARFRERFPSARVVHDPRTILEDARIRVVAAAAVPSERGPLGCQVMEHGKDYFTDKCPFTSLDQLEAARRVVARTGRKYLVYYSERLHVECAVHAGDLVRAGAVGQVLQVLGLGPHRLEA